MFTKGTKKGTAHKASKISVTLLLAEKQAHREKKKRQDSHKI